MARSSRETSSDTVLCRREPGWSPGRAVTFEGHFAGDPCSNAGPTLPELALETTAGPSDGSGKTNGECGRTQAREVPLPSPAALGDPSNSPRESFNFLQQNDPRKRCGKGRARVAVSAPERKNHRRGWATSRILGENLTRVLVLPRVTR